MDTLARQRVRTDERKSAFPKRIDWFASARRMAELRKQRQKNRPSGRRSLRRRGRGARTVGAIVFGFRAGMRTGAPKIEKRASPAVPGSGRLYSSASIHLTRICRLAESTVSTTGVKSAAAAKKTAVKTITAEMTRRIESRDIGV